MRTLIAVGCAVLVSMLPAHVATAVSDRDGDSSQAGILPPPWYGTAGYPSFDSLFGTSTSDPPRGTVVADSGFRPYPNGFSFLNYGRSLRTNQLVFGTPQPISQGESAQKAVSLNAATMQRTFGDGVCVAGTGQGGTPCRLTESALTVVRLANSWGATGHCYGMASIAAAMFNGQVDPAALGAGAVNSLTNANALSQRMIARALVAQYFSATATKPSSMAGLVEEMRQGLRPGKAPFTLLLYGKPGGHALTPFAVLDRGSGQYDIAVYDSNFPRQARAIHVDTGANSWNYLGSSDPNQLPLLWDSADPATPARMLVGSVASSTALQQCPFCRAKPAETLVSFSPVLAQNQAVFSGIRLTNTEGQPLDPILYSLIPSSNPTNGKLVNGPVLLVQDGTPFGVLVDSSNVSVPQPFAVTVVGNGSTQAIAIDRLRSDVSSGLAIDSRKHSMALTARNLSSIRMTQTLEEQAASYRFIGTQHRSLTTVGTFMRVLPASSSVIFRENHGNASTWDIKLLRRSKTSTVAFTARDIDVPARAQLVVRYDAWNGSARQPHLYLYTSASPVKVTEIPLRSA